MTKQERAVRTRYQLIAAAADVFNRNGFVRTNLAAVSRRANVSTGALYFHFERKEELAAAVVNQAVGSIRSAVQRVHHSPACALQRLVDATHAIAALLRTDSVVKAGVLLNQEGYGPRPDLRLEWHTHIQRLLAEAEREDMLAPDVSQQSAASAITASTVGFEVLGRDDLQWLSRHALTSFWGFHLPALAAGPALGRLDAAGTDIGSAHR
ncbi:ScbR family autoregulator-binding transcription factor [Streptomyces sp. B-S-A8]|uniref:ScbR family autoregulator-binding transcription factor n=1 Tax=Streptomyces solicavernae TaxID=3043614 RepID=A0ABT6RZM2_9ACTN|nr:ScbR family autoregulator-binding transcription factor [Streptomyces sp. B-S-A8]MDI3389877.1 ScbR family autoregulator-binding transcription factor [Streptomyces sp. B-S-A8]